MSLNIVVTAGYGDMNPISSRENKKSNVINKKRFPGELLLDLLVALQCWGMVNRCAAIIEVLEGRSGGKLLSKSFPPVSFS